jgi:hypothetical protein
LSHTQVLPRRVASAAPTAATPVTLLRLATVVAASAASAAAIAGPLRQAGDGARFAPSPG